MADGFARREVVSDFRCVASRCLSPAPYHPPSTDKLPRAVFVSEGNHTRSTAVRETSQESALGMPEKVTFPGAPHRSCARASHHPVARGSWTLDPAGTGLTCAVSADVRGLVP